MKLTRLFLKGTLVGLLTVVYGCGDEIASDLRATVGGSNLEENEPNSLDGNEEIADYTVEQSDWVMNSLAEDDYYSDNELAAILGELSSSVDMEAYENDETDLTSLLLTLQSYKNASDKTKEKAENAVFQLNSSKDLASYSDKEKNMIAKEAIASSKKSAKITKRLSDNGTLRFLAKSKNTRVDGLIVKKTKRVKRIVFSKGIFTNWKFDGSKGRDIFVLGGKASVITKKNGGIVDFKEDNSSDTFVFNNKINVKKCSKERRSKCHPLNNLQKVTIKNFGKEDVVVLQGKKYTYDNLRGQGFPGVPKNRLRVIKIKSTENPKKEVNKDLEANPAPVDNLPEVELPKGSDKAEIIKSAVNVPNGAPKLFIKLSDSGVLTVTSQAPVNHTMGLKLNNVAGVNKIVLDRGVYSMWSYQGSKTQNDYFMFGSQGTIINKRNGGVVDFKEDNLADVFEFTNTINVARCSEKHGFKCHPLNHLQQVVIKNFGKEDVVILQGKRYKYSDLKGNGFPGVPETRLKVQRIQY